MLHIGQNNVLEKNMTFGKFQEFVEAYSQGFQEKGKFILGILDFFKGPM